MALSYRAAIMIRCDKMQKKLKQIVSNMWEGFIIRHKVRSQKRKMSDKRRMAVVNRVSLTKRQIEKINEFYKTNFGKKIDVSWHKYYQGVSEKFCVEYIPESIYTVWERKVNRAKICSAIGNKLLQSKIFSNLDFVYLPKVYLFVYKDKWYTGEYKPISYEEAVKLAQDKGQMFVKPIEDSNSGKGCRIIDSQKEDISKTLCEYHDNYMFTEIIKNSASLSDLHPESVNTFRVMTYILDGKTYVAPILLRIGRGHHNIDNAHAGGVFIGVDFSGHLLEKAVTEFGEKFYNHPDTNIQFNGYEIKNFDKIVEASKKLHNILYNVGIVSWDLTIDHNENVVLIETNAGRGQSPWLVQMSHGKGVFAENTAKILQNAEQWNRYI